MHTKIILPSSWNFGVPDSELVKLSSRGLMGADYGVLVKRAGEEFANLVRNFKIPHDELPVHAIAMGATEAYGPNRNGDGFKEAALKLYHKTFEKLAKVYRHHKNDNPANSYGIIKFAFYNPVMRRVELLLGLNMTKEAAERNGGLVADEEMELLQKKGQDVPWSMACRIDHDVCHICDNKAKHRGEYCTPIKQGGCCSGFGCRDGLTQVLADGRIQHVDNPHPSFFDFSRVRKPADRTAFGNVADYLQKAAAAGRLPGGSELAEMLGISVPRWLRDDLPTWVQSQIKLAYELARQERELQYQTQLEKQANQALVGRTSIDVSPLGRPGSREAAGGLAALAQVKVALPIRDFVRWLSGNDKCAALADAVSARLPNVYNRLIAGDSWETDIFHSPFRPDGLPSQAQRNWAAKCAADHALDTRTVIARAARSAFSSPSLTPVVKTSSATFEERSASQLEGLARAYALYKLAFLACQDEELPLTTSLSLRQNYAIA